MAPRLSDAAITAMMLATVVVWGSAFSAIKVLLSHLDPFDAVVLRFVFAAAAYLALWIWKREAWRGAEPMDKRMALWMFVLGFFGVPVYHGFLNGGEAMIAHSASADIAASVTGLLIATTPIFTLLIAMPVLKERVSLRRVAGIVTAFLGVAVLILWGRGVPMEGEAVQGVMVVILAPLSWAVYSIIAKKLLPRVGALPLTAYSMLAGTALLFPFASPDLPQQLPDLPGIVWFWAIYLGLLATFAGYLAWNVALTRWDTTRVASFVYVTPVTSVLWAVVLVGERVTFHLAMGGAAVLLGVWLASGPSRIKPGSAGTSAPQPMPPE